MKFFFDLFFPIAFYIVFICYSPISTPSYVPKDTIISYIQYPIFSSVLRIPSPLVHANADFYRKGNKAQSSDSRTRIKVLMNLGLDQWNRDQFSNSKISYQKAKALAIKERQADQADICIALISIQDNYLNGKKLLSKNRKAAKQILWEAAKRSRELKCQNHEIKILRYFCITALDNLGDSITTKAFSRLDQLASEHLFDRERAGAWLTIGNFYMQLSQYSKALDCFFRCLKLSKDFGYKTELIQSMNNAAIAYLNMGNIWNAKRYIEEALLLSNEDSYSSFRASLLHHLAIIHIKIAHNNNNHGEFTKAINFLNEEQILSSKTNVKYSETTIFTAIANVYLYMGEIKKARITISPFLNQASNPISDFDYGPIWNISGKIALRSGDFAQAEQDFSRVLSQKKIGELNLDCVSSLYGLALCQETRGRLKEALEYYERSIDLIDNIGLSIGDDINRAFYSQTKAEIYEDWINCISLYNKNSPPNQIQAIFRAIERIKAQSFLEFRAKRTKNSSDRKPVDVLDFQKKYLNSRTAFIEYWLGQKASYLIILTKDQNHLLELPSLSVFEESLSGYLDYLQDPHSDRTKELKGAARVYREVLQPVMDIIPSTVQHLIISSDGILNRLPFEALVMEESQNGVARRVIDRFSVSYVPSASTYTRIVEQTTPEFTVKTFFLSVHLNMIRLIPERTPWKPHRKS